VGYEKCGLLCPVTGGGIGGVAPEPHVLLGWAGLFQRRQTAQTECWNLGICLEARKKGLSDWYRV